MSDSTSLVRIDGIELEVVRKNVKHVRFTVYPPDGRVRVSAPTRFSDKAIHAAITSKLSWIHRHRGQIRSREWATPIRMADGEQHLVWGREHTLRILEGVGTNRVVVDGGVIVLHVSPGADTDRRRTLLDDWCRSEMKAVIPNLITRWEPIIGVDVAEWGVKKMKTRWGSCNPKARRIWLGLGLAKRHPDLLEYVVVHEMVHILERLHGDRFKSLMSRFLPDWRQRRDQLDGLPSKANS